ncbi:MAG: hypothetical protein V1894_01150 [Chloroflexota bacterium]
MENRPAMSFSGISPTPGVDSETYSRFLNWMTEVYAPLHMTIPGRTGMDSYKIVTESPEYPSLLSLLHYKNIQAREASLTNPERIAVANELNAWIKRRVMVYVWVNPYELVKSFRNKQFKEQSKGDTMIENAPILHIEGYRFRPGDQEKYANWLNDYASSSFVPLIMRLPGIKGYDFYENIGGKTLVEAREWEYPDSLSALYFEDMVAFENYTKSPELLALKKGLLNTFPNGLNLRWYVQYQLIGSWRK